MLALGRFRGLCHAILPRRLWRVTFLMVAGVVLIGGGASEGQAQGAQVLLPEEIYLDAEVIAPFEPKQVFFLVAFSQVGRGEDSDHAKSGRVALTAEGEVVAPPSPGSAPEFRRYQGQIYAHPVAQVGTAGSAGSPAQPSPLRVGTRVHVPRDARMVHFAAILAAPQNRFALIAPRSTPLNDPELFYGQPERLREHIQQLRRRVQQVQRESDELEAELRRLRTDADLIADLSRIVDAREELARLRRMTDELVLDKENLKSFVQGVQAVPAPRSFASRERQLNAQLAELVVIEKQQSSQPQASGRMPLAERESLEAMLAVIEAARGLDLEALRAERAELNGDRGQRIEGGGGRGVESPENYIQ